MKSLERLGQAWQVAGRFRAELARERLRIGGGMLLLFTAVLLELARPWPLQWLVDNVLLGVESTGGPEGDAGRVVVIVAALAFAILGLRAVVEYAATLLVTSAGHAVTRALRLRIFSHLIELSPTFHARHKSGDLLVRLMGDVPMLKDMLVEGGVQLAVRSVQVVATLGFLVWLDPLLAAAVLIPAPLLALLVWFLSNRLRIAVRKQRRKEGELADYLHEAVASTTMLQSMGRGPHAVRRFARSNRRSARAGLKAARAAARLACSVEVVLALAFSGALALGAWRVVDGHLSTGELLVFLSYVRGLSKPVRSAGRNQARIAKGTACGERILAVLDESLELRTSAGSRAVPERPRKIELDDVSFVYDDGTTALQGVSAQLHRGELTALVGPSGAGKSTFVALALRVFDPTDGVVRLDGEPLAEYDLDALRLSFGVALQSNVLFGESLRENLLLGDDEADEEEMLSALDAAGVGDLVRGLPQGLDTVLGSAGVGLSGGEARRVCLARAVLRDAPVLIADEPFAGLDAASADAVAATLRAAARDRIVLVVTHDLGRLGGFDQVLQLEGGRIVSARRSDRERTEVESGGAA